MTSAARSVLVFGIYLAAIGVLLVLVPNLLLAVVFLPPTSEVWVRIAGMLTLFLSFFFIQSARSGLTPFYHWTVYTRTATIFFLAAFVFAGLASPYLIPFGIIDLAGALWTGLALRGTGVTRV